MNSFEVLSAAVPSEHAQWLNIWQSWPDGEVSAHPSYVKLFAHADDTCMCAVWVDTCGTILFPLIMRPIDSEPWADGMEEMCDCVSPYGYGGPFAWGKPDAARFWSNLSTWAGDNRVSSLFTRLPLFEDQRVVFDGDVKFTSINVVRDLHGTSYDIWMDYEHKVRKNVNKARRSGLVVVIDESTDRLDDFLDIYYATMDRRQAVQSYYFRRSFFEQLTSSLIGHFRFAHCFLDGEVVSTELILVSNRCVYSFLGGTRENAFDLRPNDLLKHEIIEWALNCNKAAFVLGGGYAPDDGILKYKRSFAPNGDVPFYVGRRVYDQEKYQRLVSQRSAWELTQSHVWEPRPDYFPAYRS